MFDQLLYYTPLARLPVIDPILPVRLQNGHFWYLAIAGPPRSCYYRGR